MRADRMLSSAGFRYHLLFSYRPVTPQRHGTDDNGESEQRVAELIDAVTELFTKQSKTQDLLTKLLSDFASLQVQTQAPQASSDAIPATQPYDD